MNLPELCRRIELILSDVDGVLTDGGVVYDNQGVEIKKFHIRDGLGIKLWQRAGYKFGVLTARTSHIVKVRASELGIDLVRQGFERKLPAPRKSCGN
jgi:YrbI family 3-deoxy-D-manno-octulosonate 8-phosphate phosphatase